MSKLITISDGGIALANEHIYRTVRTTDGPATAEFNLRPAGAFGADVWLPSFKPKVTVTPFGAQPLEAAVTIGGELLLAGPFDPDPNQMYTREGAFDVVNVAGEDTELGEAATLTCRGREGREIPVELRIRYEIAADLPLLIKQVTVVNISDAPVTLDNVAVEMIKSNRLDHELNVFTDWYEQYGPCRIDDEYYRTWTRFEAPEPMCMTLEPGAELQSFRVFEYVAPNETQAKAVAHHRIFKRLAPWASRPVLQQQVNEAGSLDELFAIADHAADDGVEIVHLYMNQMFTNIGDYVLREDIFPDGDDDVKRMVERFHKNGVRLLPYMGLTIAWEESELCKAHGDWRYLGPDGLRYKGWSHGNMCYQSDWGPYILEIIRWLLDDLGFDGLHIDGPYHGLPCLEQHHAHPTPESVHYMNWDWERRFFAEMACKGMYVSVPQDPAAILFGANARPHGHTEEDMTVMDGMPLVTAVRTRNYDTRYELPSSCCCTPVLIDQGHQHTMEIGEETSENYELALGGCIGYGEGGWLHGRQLHFGPETEKIYRRWKDFFFARRDTLSGEMIHLVRPDGKHGDACMHVNPDADPPAVIVALNPGDEPATLDLSLPLGYAGFAPHASAAIQDVGIVQLDDRATGSVLVDIPAGTVLTLDVRPA